MNKEDFVKLIEPFTSPEVETIMGEGLEILHPPYGRGLEIKNKLLFVDNGILLYSTNKNHYYFKFKHWHDAKVPFNPSMKWSSDKSSQYERSISMLHYRDYPINEMNGGLGWRCDNYQIIPENYLKDYFGIGYDFLNWVISKPWEVKE